DARHQRDRPWEVVGAEVAGRTDVLPGELFLLEDRPDRKPDRGERDRSCGDSPRRQRAAGEEHAARHRLALEIARHLRGRERHLLYLGAVAPPASSAVALDIRSISHCNGESSACYVLRRPRRTAALKAIKGCYASCTMSSSRARRSAT